MSFPLTVVKLQTPTLRRKDSQLLQLALTPTFCFAASDWVKPHTRVTKHNMIGLNREEVGKFFFFLGSRKMLSGTCFV